jgi:NADH-quinone oxidoreductase subunit L
MSLDFPLHLIILLPFIGSAFALLLGKRVGKDAVTMVSCGVIAAAALVAIKAVVTLHNDLPPGGTLIGSLFEAPWIASGDLNISAGLMLDRLSAVLLLVVTGIGFLIHVYSTAYMEHDAGYTRFMGYLNLFMGAMLILVLGDSLLVTFVGWEGVGLCSYLLIGFWYDKEAYALAGRKAFVVNRVGDFGFLLAMFLLFTYAGTLKYGALGGAMEALRTHAWFGMPVAYFVGILLLVGATGKSAQIPLFVWLPDAMAGPTPVSALIHAATMVTAGVYVVARMHVVFEIAPATLGTVAGIGAATALFAATIGIVQKDFKKILAYSTISQLGFSHIHATSNYQAGIFHLMTHAFFKAGLFLGAGSVLHAVSNDGDITRMGGLKKAMPHTRWTFLICCLAIAGVPPFAGFWSKDSILAGAHAMQFPMSAHPNWVERFFAGNGGTIIWVTLLVAAGCTAFYMFRLYYLVFEGEFRGSQETKHHLHESPAAMTVVLWVLAIGSIVVGFLGIPEALPPHHNLFGEWLSPVLPPQAIDESASKVLVGAAIATAISGAGIGLAYVLYGKGISERVKKLVTSMPRLYKLVLNKYYVDEIYHLLIVRPLKWFAYVLWKAVDIFIIDLLLVNGVGFLVSGVGKLVRYFQNGDLQRYVIGILAGGALILWAATNWPVRQAAKFEAKVTDEAKHEVTVTAQGGGPTAKRLQFRVDWDGNNKFGALQSTPVFRHQYDSAGKKKIAVEAVDPRWGTTKIITQTVKIP